MQAPGPELVAGLADAVDAAIGRLESAAAARDLALTNCRQSTRHSANAIRALHRGDTARAAGLLADAKALLDEATGALDPFPNIRWAGFVHDAQKEYAEGRLSEAITSGASLPDAAALGVTVEAWLHGIAEAIGEMRRRVLDLLRDGDIATATALFGVMEDCFDILVRIDFPDAMTNGLRRATDADRGILERTRADLSMAAVQRRLELALEARLDGDA